MERRESNNPFKKFNTQFASACKTGESVDYRAAIEAFPNYPSQILCLNYAKLIECYVSLARGCYDNKNWHEMGENLIYAARLIKDSSYNKLICATNDIYLFKARAKEIMHHHSKYKTAYLIIEAHLILSNLYTSEHTLHADSAIASFEKGMELMLITAKSNPNYPSSLMTLLCHSMDCLRSIRPTIEQRATIQGFVVKMRELIEEHPETPLLFYSEAIKFDKLPQGFRFSKIKKFSNKLASVINNANQIYMNRKEWFGDNNSDLHFSIRQQRVSSVLNLLGDLRLSPFKKNKYNQYLQAVCRITIAALYEYESSEDNAQFVVSRLDQAWESLLSIDFPTNSVNLKTLHPPFSKKRKTEISAETVVFYRETFYQAMMLSCINLSKAYFKTLQYDIALPILVWGDRYYQLCEKNRDGIKNYEKQYAEYYKTILDVWSKQFKDKVHDDFSWSNYLCSNLEELSKTALCLLSSDEIAQYKEINNLIGMLFYLKRSQFSITFDDLHNGLGNLVHADQYYQSCDKSNSDVREYEKKFKAYFKQIINCWQWEVISDSRDVLFDRLIRLAVRNLSLFKNDHAVLKRLEKLFSLRYIDFSFSSKPHLKGTAKLINGYISLANIHYDASNWPKMSKALINAEKLMKAYTGEGSLYSLRTFKERAKSILEQGCSLYRKHALMASAYIKLGVVYRHSKISQINSSIAAVRAGFDLLLKIPLSMRRSSYESRHYELFDAINGLMYKRNKLETEQQRAIEKLFERALKLIKEYGYDCVQFSSSNTLYDDFMKNKMIDCNFLRINKSYVVQFATDLIVSGRDNRFESSNKKFRLEKIETSRAFFEDLSKNKYTDTNNTLLFDECAITLAALHEHPVSTEQDLSLAAEGLQQAGKLLMTRFEQTNPLYSMLRMLSEIKGISVDIIPSFYDILHQAIMLSYLNLSESYFKASRFSSALRLLLRSEQYYQLCDPTSFSMEKYRKQFNNHATIIFKTMIEHCNNNTFFDYDWNVDKLSMDRLCRLSDSQTSLLNNSRPFEQVKTVVFFTLLHKETDIYKRSNLFYTCFNKYIKHTSSKQRDELTHQFILFARTYLSEANYKKAVKIFREGLPLINLCASPYQLNRFSENRYRRNLKKLVETTSDQNELGKVLLDQILNAFDLFPNALRKARSEKSVQAYERALHYYPTNTSKRDKNYVGAVECHIFLAKQFEEKQQWVEMAAELSDIESLMKAFQKNLTVLKKVNVTSSQNAVLVGSIATSIIQHVTLNDFILSIAKQRPLKLATSPQYVMAMMYIKLSMMYAEKSIVEIHHKADKEVMNRALDTFAIGFDLLKKSSQQEYSNYLIEYLKECFDRLITMPYSHEHYDELRVLRGLVQKATKKNKTSKLSVFSTTAQLSEIDELIRITKTQGLMHFTDAFNDIMNKRDSWLSSENIRKLKVDSIQQRIDAIKNNTIKTDCNHLLEKECALLLAVLCEHDFSNKTMDRNSSILLMHKAGQYLSKLTNDSSDPVFKNLSIRSVFINMDTFPNVPVGEEFNVAIMLACFHLSELYINELQFKQGVRVLNYAIPYYQKSHKDSEIKLCEERFIALFNHIVRLRTKRLKKGVNESLFEFENITSLSALPLIKNDKSALQAFYTMRAKSQIDDIDDFTQLIKIIKGYRKFSRCPANEKLDYVYHTTLSRAPKIGRYISEQHIYLLESFALIAALRQSHHQLPKMKNFLLKALPLLHFNADMYELSHDDVVLFEKRCQSLTSCDAKHASQFVLPMLCLQLELQASILYCKNDMPQQALWTLSAALKGIKAILDPSPILSEDYQRLIDSALLIAQSDFSEREDWQGLIDCINQLLSLISSHHKLNEKEQFQFSMIPLRIVDKLDALTKNFDAFQTFENKFSIAKSTPSEQAYINAINDYPSNTKPTSGNYVAYVDCCISLVAIYYKQENFSQMRKAFKKAVKLMEGVQFIKTAFYKAIFVPGAIAELKSLSQTFEAGTDFVNFDFLMTIAYLRLSLMYTSDKVTISNDSTNTLHINLAFDAFETSLVYAQNLTSLSDRSLNIEDKLMYGIGCLGDMPLARRHGSEFHRFNRLIMKMCDLLDTMPAPDLIGGIVITFQYIDRLTDKSYLNKLSLKNSKLQNNALSWMQARARAQFSEIMDNRADWLNDISKRQAFKKSVITIKDELNNAKIKNGHEETLLNECTLLQVVLSEENWSTLSSGATKTLMNNIAQLIQPILLASHDKWFKSFCACLTKADQNLALLFNQVLMFAYLELSKACINKGQYDEAIRILSYADDYYYHVANKIQQDDCLVAYRQEFTRVFKQVLQNYTQKMIKGHLRYNAKSFEKCGLTALPLLKKDKTTIKEYDRFMILMGKKDHVGGLQQMVRTYRVKKRMPSEKLLMTIERNLLSLFQVTHFSTATHTHMLEFYVLASHVGLFDLQKNRFSWLKGFFENAQPLIRLYGNHFNTNTADVETFQQRCACLVEGPAIEADKLIVPLLQVQLLLQISRMYCDYQVNKPHYALMAFSEAFALFNALPTNSLVKKSDYERFVHGIIAISQKHLPTMSDWGCLDTHLCKVLSMITPQKDLLNKYHKALSAFSMKATAGIDNAGKINHKSWRASTAKTTSTDQSKSNGDGFIDSIVKSVSGFSKRLSIWSNDDEEAHELTQLISRSKKTYAGDQKKLGK